MLATLALAAVCGVATWTLAEYSLHNWYGHLGRGRNDFSREHLRHHARYLYFAPTHKKVLTALAVAAVVTPIAVLVAGWPHGLIYSASLVGFYGLYERLHRRAHTHAPRSRYGRWLRRHHLYHHFGDARQNHGVTTPIWDIVFGTYTAPAGPILVPPKMVLPWMMDESGQIRAELRADYELAVRA